MPRLARITITLALGLSLLMTSQYLSFVQFEEAIYGREGLDQVILSLARLQTALVVFTLTSLGLIFAPYRSEN